MNRIRNANVSLSIFNTNTPQEPVFDGSKQLPISSSYDLNVSLLRSPINNPYIKKEIEKAFVKNKKRKLKINLNKYSIDASMVSADIYDSINVKTSRTTNPNLSFDMRFEFAKIPKA